ncbi:MAG: response regulator, partial [Pseudomonadota bacterium]
MRVLIIEDDKDMASFVERVLKESGHVVDVANRGDAGLMMARASDFDALVVDRMLPEKDGITLVREFREGGGQAPVLFLSALGEVEHRVEGLKVGGDDYLSKPFAPSE